MNPIIRLGRTVYQIRIILINYRKYATNVSQLYKVRVSQCILTFPLNSFEKRVLNLKIEMLRNIESFARFRSGYCATGVYQSGEKGASRQRIRRG